MGSKPSSRKNKLFLKGLLLFVFVFVLFNVSFSFGVDSNYGGGEIVNTAMAQEGMGAESNGVKNKGPSLIAALLGDTAAGLAIAMNFILIGVLNLCTLMLHAAGFVFDFIIQPKSFVDLMDQESLRKTWGVVRDLLNIGFILFLLFSAFATIFQVEKYSIKKVLLTLVIMALLVNFSYPISRFIIDMANVPMYYLLNLNFGGDTSSAATILKDTNIGKFSSFSATSAETGKIMMAIVFTFIMAITMLVLAVMFVIRTAMLAILVVFSSVGFIAAAFPATKKYSTMWWDNLFKYAFFGPIMVFMLYVATQFTASVLKDPTIKAAIDVTANNSANDPEHVDFLANVIHLALPVVLLWAGMIVANKMGIAGASMVTGKASSFAKGVGRRAGRAGLAVGTFGGYGMAKRNIEGYKAARKLRLDQRSKDSSKTIGGKIGKGVGTAADKAQSLVPFARKSAKERLKKTREAENKKAIKDGAESLVDSGESAASLAKTANSNFGKQDKKKDQVKQAQIAAAYIKQDFNDKKAFVEDSVKNNGGRDIDGILAASAESMGITDLAQQHTYNREKGEIQRLITAANAPGGAINKDEIEKITSFINKQMKAKVAIGAKADAKDKK